MQDATEGKKEGDAPTTTDAPAAAANATVEPQPLADITNKANDRDDRALKEKAGAQRARRERGPPADGIPSKTKVMVANLPYDLTEDKVGR